MITRSISIDSLKKVQYLEDLLDSFPKKDYYIYYCYVTRSGKGYVTKTTAVENHISRGQLRAPIISDLFQDRDHPPKPNQKFVFDRIFIRKFNDKNSSETFPSLELFVIN